MLRKFSERKKKKYNFSSPESQKLFEEFSVLLAEVTTYLESREERILALEEELSQVTRIRYMIRIILKKIWKLFYKIIIFIPQKLKNTFHKLKETKK